MHDSPFQLLIATILSAQCTDKTVNEITPNLFAQYPDPNALSRANQKDIEQIIKPSGFFHVKAKHIIETSRILREQYAHQVPCSMDELTKLPGVGRKTANVLLSNAFEINSGIVVDTHVKRISWRLGLTASNNAERVERDLIKIFPQHQWGEISHLFIYHGRTLCRARGPICTNCPLNSFCSYNKK